MLTRRSVLAGLALAGTACPTAVSAQSYPTRTVKIVVPFPPGTPSEFVIRTLADRLSAKFKQPVIIENRPGGAGGTVGAASVATADPDGYTLLASPPGPLVTARAMYKNLPYDPAKLVPVALLFNSPQLLAVHPSVPVTTVKELAQYAAQNPRTVNYASPGYGTQPHLLGEIFKLASNADIVHVPYKSPAAALTDLLAGQVQMYFETSPPILPQAQAGKLRVLAIAGASRMTQLPHTPTTIEAGYTNLVGGFWSGLVAPPGTPPEIVTTINAAANEVVRSPEVQAAMERLGARERLGSPADFRDFIAAETIKWTEIIRTAGVKVD